MKKNPIFNFDLRSDKASNINIWNDDNEDLILNFFPNLPGIKLMVQDWIVQENHFWLVTLDVPDRIYDHLLSKGLVPLTSSCYTYEEMRKTYYNQN